MDDQTENEPETEIDIPLEAEMAEEPVEQGETPLAEADVEEEQDVLVSIGDELPVEDEEAKSAPAWVKNLRREHKAAQRELKQLKSQLQRTGTSEPAQVSLPPKPTLESSDYDTERFEANLASWYEQKRVYEQQEAARQSAVAEAQASWKQRLDTYQTERNSLKARDYEEAEAVVADTLSITQQGMILSGAEKPALLIYALGKNPKKAAEMAAIQDPVKFAFAVARLETTLKIQNRKPSAAPERSPSGTAPKSGNADSTLERLRAEAERTGDLSKVIAYKRQLKAKRA